MELITIIMTDSAAALCLTKRKRSTQLNGTKITRNFTDTYLRPIHRNKAIVLRAYESM